MMMMMMMMMMLLLMMIIIIMIIKIIITYFPERVGRAAVFRELSIILRFLRQSCYFCDHFVSPIFRLGL